jgi:hypothetical protein
MNLFSQSVPLCNSVKDFSLLPSKIINYLKSSFPIARRLSGMGCIVSRGGMTPGRNFEAEWEQTHSGNNWARFLCWQLRLGWGGGEVKSSRETSGSVYCPMRGQRSSLGSLITFTNLSRLLIEPVILLPLPSSPPISLFGLPSPLISHTSIFPPNWPMSYSLSTSSRRRK